MSGSQNRSARSERAQGYLAGMVVIIEIDAQRAERVT
jgi:hypothetical protein